MGKVTDKGTLYMFLHFCLLDKILLLLRRIFPHSRNVILWFNVKRQSATRRTQAQQYKKSHEKCTFLCERSYVWYTYSHCMDDLSEHCRPGGSRGELKQDQESWCLGITLWWFNMIRLGIQTQVKSHKLYLQNWAQKRVGIEYAWKGVMLVRQRGNYSLRSLTHGSCLLWLQWQGDYSIPLQSPSCQRVPHCKFKLQSTWVQVAEQSVWSSASSEVINFEWGLEESRGF